MQVNKERKKIKEQERRFWLGEKSNTRAEASELQLKSHATFCAREVSMGLSSFQTPRSHYPTSKKKEEWETCGLSGGRFLYILFAVLSPVLRTVPGTAGDQACVEQNPGAS